MLCGVLPPPTTPYFLHALALLSSPTVPPRFFFGFCPGFILSWPGRCHPLFLCLQHPPALTFPGFLLGLFPLVFFPLYFFFLPPFFPYRCYGYWLLLFSVVVLFFFFPHPLLPDSSFQPAWLSFIFKTFPLRPHVCFLILLGPCVVPLFGFDLFFLPLPFDIAWAFVVQTLPLFDSLVYWIFCSFPPGTTFFLLCSGNFTPPYSLVFFFSRVFTGPKFPFPLALFFFSLCPLCCLAPPTRFPFPWFLYCSVAFFLSVLLPLHPQFLIPFMLFSSVFPVHPAICS